MAPGCLCGIIILKLSSLSAYKTGNGLDRTARAAFKAKGEAALQCGQSDPAGIESAGWSAGDYPSLSLSLLLISICVDDDVLTSRRLSNIPNTFAAAGGGGGGRPREA